MPVTIATAEDSWLEAKARFKEWKTRFEVEWFEPHGRMWWGMLSSRMSPAEHQFMQMRDPWWNETTQRIIQGGAYGKGKI